MSRVLIVEDQPAIAEALSVLFEIHDIPFDVAATPGDALAKIAEGTVGVVLQDMNFAPSATSGEEGIALFRAREPEGRRRDNSSATLQTVFLF